MKKLLILITLALATVASVFVCNTANAVAFSPWNVQFEVEYKGDVFCYDLSSEIQSCSEQAAQRGFYLGYNGKKALYDQLVALKLDPLAIYHYMLPNFDKALHHFSYVEQQKVDATVSFDKSGFTYHKGQDGVAIDAKQLFEKALASQGKVIRLTLPLTVDKAVTVAELKQNTVVKAKFTTTYYASGANRCYNVAKAASALNGVTVGVGEKFSFNDVVGERTVERGYKTSKVIQDGNYTDGVGGGVCQVSTTLYNALLLAGFIPKACQHSLVSSYVKTGFDAMVSDGVADLTFVNDTAHPIYIEATTRDKAITFTIYGEPNVYRIERVSTEQREPFQTIEIVDKTKFPELVYTDQTKVVTSGSDGVKSQSFLNYYLGDKLVATKKIRTNTYKRVDQVIAHGALERPDHTREGTCTQSLTLCANKSNTFAVGLGSAAGDLRVY